MNIERSLTTTWNLIVTVHHVVRALPPGHPGLHLSTLVKLAMAHDSETAPPTASFDTRSSRLHVDLAVSPRREPDTWIERTLGLILSRKVAHGPRSDAVQNTSSHGVSAPHLLQL